MSPDLAIWLPCALLVAAFLYASVGHGGATAYLALMALAGMTPDAMRPAALLMNVLVSSLACWRFWRVGSLAWRIFCPLVVASVPCAWLGSRVALNLKIYLLLLAGVLFVAAAQLAFRGKESDEPTRPMAIPVALGVGGSLGFLAGLTGIGGGVFLTPLLILCRWAQVRMASGLSAGFILLNSLAGLAGLGTSAWHISRTMMLWLVCVGLGGLAGATLGAKRFQAPVLRKLLAVVLLITAVKLVHTAVIF